MSVAFTKEDSAETAAETILPDRTIPEGPNLVTREGLAGLEAMLATARRAYEAAMAIEDVNERRRQAAGPLRDMRYFSERLRTAQLVPPPVDAERVAFGSIVTVEREDGRVQTYRIVGEDEADPRAGTISIGSPMARALMGKVLGEETSVAGASVVITAIA
ncbi:Transcription elongation factor, GreA/GreB family [Devosia enhydra]|uniref:Transcription elongation factor, GreA/GreB family n=1 Tax=Devosia enhydra TaxID=665118 RepID=A0A1K2HTA5_9HYPH|nr:transcription elongation factor GreA [Devosia enhydra]SFZ81407.1 Transcription elongation factor, GreA/GreB family [Devosia enhydra]